MLRPRPWCWEGLGAGGEGDDRGWDGWMASLTQWTWVWVNSGSWWWTGRPGVLWFMGSQRVRHDWANGLNWSEAYGASPWWPLFLCCVFLYGHVCIVPNHLIKLVYLFKFLHYLFHQPSLKLAMCTSTSTQEEEIEKKNQIGVALLFWQLQCITFFVLRAKIMFEIAGN